MSLDVMKGCALNPYKVEENEKKSTKSFSINSILARVEKEKCREDRCCSEEKDVGRERVPTPSDKDVPAVISKLDFPVIPGFGRGFPDMARLGEASTGSNGGLLPLGHLPAWYHWYASHHSLQQWQQHHKKCKHHKFVSYFLIGPRIRGTRRV
ncbi:hypothetical protein DPMN_166963 [Dreissena polymorpha]|uniref:Uncharacterized protein n=1 Tax=Dreissena polymorpha TaxID=45954 RepID=A0A9D4F2D2_DREPO|nr:hypothetical protein DPMN_166963 [Dreissena polymorpha]